MSATVRLATADDDGRLRAFNGSHAMPGAVRLAIVRGFEPDAQTVVAERAGRIVGTGRRVVRKRFVNGRLEPVAYLSTLRLDDPDKRVILRGYGVLRELHEQDDRPFTFTSVMGDNRPALALFARPRRGLPAYQRIGGYVTHAVRPEDLWKLRTRPRGLCHRLGGDSAFQLARRPGPALLPAPEIVVTGYGPPLSWLRWALPLAGVSIPLGCLTRAGLRGNLDDAGREARARGWRHVLVGAPARLGRGRVLRSVLFGVRWPGDAWHLDDRPVWPEVADL